MKTKKKPDKPRVEQIVFYNIVKDDASFLDKLVKWLIILHYPLYISFLAFDLFLVRYKEDGYIGPASMIAPMSLTGAIIVEFAYFVVLTYITIALLISMKSYKESKQKRPIKH